ncbi:MAG: hypothetical protein M3R03_10840 [Pseudomonadota bacterium]|nr:hypothetical protein [Pseudomonadota bacterium]
MFAPFLRLPDEQEEAYKLRASSVEAALYDEERRSWQQGLYDRAERVFFAKVLDNRELSTRAVPELRITVQPVRAVKGELPTTTVNVQENRHASCQIIVGGVRRSAKAGDYTIVFDGTRLNAGDLPTTREISIHEARDPRLIQALRDWDGAESRLRRAGSQ